ncbi:MAG TPA: tetratricopeptide repeat protein [Gemmatimonadaceae bacterium]|nr:tetratricopeptide repeat protein [Gemmatimonadaceae bacterium]
MDAPPSAIAHLPFLEALAGMTESSPRWQPTLAGFLTLRFVEKWADTTDGAPAPLLKEINAVHRAVDEVDDPRIRELLDDIITATTRSWGQQSSAVTAAVLNYAQHLRELEAWSLAADAFDTFVRHALTSDERQFLPIAYVRLGACQRVAGDSDAALAAYEAGGECAERAGDIQTALMARLGAAHVMKDRGNYPAAELMLDDVIAKASGVEALADVLARAKHDRGVVATDRGDTERAVVLYYEALNAYKDERGRQRVLVDIAYNLTALGLVDAARDAFRALYASATESYGRAIAAINLMYLAQLGGRELEFELFRRELATSALPPRGTAHYFLYAGEGLRRFGRNEAARVAYGRALEIATRHRFNVILLQADGALEAMRRHEALPPTPILVGEEPASVAHVIKAVRELCEQAIAPH